MLFLNITLFEKLISVELLFNNWSNSLKSHTFPLVSQ